LLRDAPALLAQATDAPIAAADWMKVRRLIDIGSPSKMEGSWLAPSRVQFLFDERPPGADVGGLGDDGDRQAHDERHLLVGREDAHPEVGPFLLGPV